MGHIVLVLIFVCEQITQNVSKLILYFAKISRKGRRQFLLI